MSKAAWEAAADEAMASPALIVVPSLGRAGRVMTRRLFPEAVLFVADREAPIYGEKEGGAIEVYPDAMIGNIAMIRNALRKRWPARNIVTIDDDLVAFGNFEGGRYNAMTRDAVLAVIENGFEMAADVGAYLWGVNLAQDRRFYREYSPISFLSPVLGPFTCHRPNPLTYDERFPLKEDYDFALQHFQRFRKVLRLNKYYYNVLHLTNDGGVTKFRTIAREEEQLNALQRKWGREIVRFDLARSLNPTIHTPLRGI